ncbi:hypothetical protein ACFLRU_01050 [Bacteroidota bacterium]
MLKFSLKQRNNIWLFPIIFGLLGGLMGLFLRYVFTGVVTSFSLKNILHSHSHVMLLGFVFNALVSILWIQFTEKIDRTSYYFYLALQVCVSLLLVAFLLQGYAPFTIVFSTLHLWLSYVLLIRLWKRLKGVSVLLNLVKIGIVLNIVASIGPYLLGPLKVFGMQDSPWYRQAIFFYLHFQYFGSFFIWFLAVFLKQTELTLSKKQVSLIVISSVLLYAHSLDYSFDHWAITVVGTIGSVILFFVFLSKKELFYHKKLSYRLLYIVLLSVLLLNCFGSIPVLSEMVVSNRFILIAWLHLLFLGLYLPFIWIELPVMIKPKIWVLYILFVVFTELLLLFPSQLSDWFSTSIMTLLFLAYLGVVLCISIVHLKYIFERIKT